MFKMADVLIRSAVGTFSSRVLLCSSSRMWSTACYLGSTARLQKVTERVMGTAGQLTTNLGFSEPASVDTKMCMSRGRFVRRLSNQSDVILPGHVTTAQSHDLEKSPEYQPLHVIPFALVQGGKTVAHLILKRNPKRALVFVRAKVLAVELIKELQEYRLKCSSAEDVPSEETGDIETSITVMTEGELETMESFMPVDLILLVQQPVAGKSFTLNCLKKAHAKVKPLEVVLLYAQNDLPFLSQMSAHVEVKRLNPPSFCNVPVLYQTEGLPSLPEESVVLPGRHLIEPPPPEITATIAPKKPPFKVFHPLVPVRTKQSERYRLNDRAYIYVRAGSGGQGSSLFGGVGGDGGDIFVECVKNATLAHFSRKENRRICAEHGTFFSRKKGKRQNTVRGRDVVIPVPVGTTVTTEDGQILGELEEVGSRVLVAQGGRGGSPGTEGWCGETGQRGIIRLDLRLVADVALVGFPNAGKSSLLRAISRATPKTAHYAFTTMRPNIGMVEYEDHSQVSVADLPGLIEGASMNRGLGHTFLKHTEKARALALVVDIDGFQLSEKYPQRTALENVCILLKELGLYDKELLDRPKMLIVTKLDRKGATSRFQALKQNLHAITKPDALLRVLQEIHASSPTTQEHTSLLDLANELTGTSFESTVPFSAVTFYGLENVLEKLKQLTLTRCVSIKENEIHHSGVY